METEVDHGQQLLELLEAASLGGWDLDLLTSKVMWTARTRRIHEVDDSFVPDLQRCLAFYPPEARPQVELALHDAAASGRQFQFELPIVTARGNRRSIRARGRVIARDGRPVRLLGTVEDITAEHAERAERERLALVVRQMTNGVIITDPTGVTTWVNDAMCRMSGYAPEELIGRKPGELLQGPRTSRAVRAEMRDAIVAGRSFSVEVVNYTKDRVPYWAQIDSTPWRDPQGQLLGFIAVESDVSERVAAQRRVAAANTRRARADALLREIVDALPVAVAAYDSSERLLIVNRTYREMLPEAARYARRGVRLEQQLRSASRDAGLPTPEADDEEREQWLQRYLKELRAGDRPRTLTFPNGRSVWATERRSANGALVCVRTDVTELKKAGDTIRRQAETDALTGLANRVKLFADLELQLQHQRGEHTTGGMLAVLDCDHFKSINDTLGHDVGDAFLTEMARRIAGVIRSGDLAARLGGDEFAVLAPGLVAADHAIQWLTRLGAALQAPVTVAGRPLLPSVSIGAAFYPGNGRDARSVFKNADIALYAAKRAGRGRFSLFERSHYESLVRREQLTQDLREALAADRIEVAWQPKVRLSDGAHAGFEALARWSRRGTAVPAGEFVALAEETGLIVPLGRAVLQQSCALSRRLRDRGLDPGRVAVNVAALQLAQPEFVEELKTTLRRYHLEPAAIEIEVTETVLLDRAAGPVEATLKALHALGVSIALDDFGTGYASLAHLQRFPVQRLKIDRSFVRSVTDVAGASVIARTIVSLAHSLGMIVVAEGVETAEQRSELLRLGCDEAQGFLIAPALKGVQKIAAYLGTVREPAERDAASALDTGAREVIRSRAARASHPPGRARRAAPSSVRQGDPARGARSGRQGCAAPADRDTVPPAIDPRAGLDGEHRARPPTAAAAGTPGGIEVAWRSR